MDNTQLAQDDARRVAQHAAVRTQIEGNVNAEIRAQARMASPGQAARIAQVAGDYRGRALDESLSSEYDVSRSRGAARISQFVDYAFYVIYSLLAIRLVLALIGANTGSGFVEFINAVTYPLYIPFRGIVASPTAEGFTLALPVAIAIVIYMVVHKGVNGILRLAGHRKIAMD